MAVGGLRSVVRALAAQASDLGSIPSGFPVLFHIPSFQPVSVVYQHLANTERVSNDNWMHALIFNV